MSPVGARRLDALRTWAAFSLFVVAACELETSPLAGDAVGHGETAAAPHVGTGGAPDAGEADSGSRLEEDATAAEDDAADAGADAGCVPPSGRCDGRCVALDSDPESCGVCGRECPVDAACTDGECLCGGIDVACGDDEALRCCWLGSLCAGAFCMPF
jgi:hypothetical protein